MRLVVIGTGDVGGAVADALAARHEVLRASRNAADPAMRLDISDPASIRSFYERAGRLDGVVCCAGSGSFGALPGLKDEDFDFTLKNKVMGQVNLVRFGHPHVSDGGVFVLTSGIFSTKPPPGVPALAMANGAIESFVRAASQDLPRGQRLDAVSPPFLHETATRMGMAAAGQLSAADNAKTYVDLVEGTANGQVVSFGG